MRSFITAILLFAVTLLSAQTTQKGYVKTKGRIDNNGQLIPGKRIAGAAIQLTGGHSTVGDANGNFTLTVPDRKFYLSDVRKQGYVLSDPDVLKKQYACSANPLVITMETPERQADDQLAAERKLRRQLQAKLQQREQEIDSLKEHHKISEEEYRQALQQLYAEQENNERLISDMARRYAELDYDLLDEFYRQVSFCLEKGDLVKADSLLASKGDVRQAVLDQQQKAQALQERKKQLRRAEAVFAADNEEVARRCYGYFERFSTQFQNDSAAYYLELRATLDTTNVQWQLDVANFVDAYLAQYRKATSYYERALRQAIAQNGTQHPAVATCYNNIGLLCKVQGQYAQAMEYYQNSLEIWKSVYGENHPDVATTYNNIGGVHYSQGEYPQAMDCFRKALSISRAVCGENHPDVATCYNNIGLTYYSQGDYEQAMSYYRKSLDIQKMVYGENHPDVATSYNNMGVVCYFQQDYDQAKAYYLKSLAISKAVYGDNHPEVAVGYNNIGLVYYLQDDYPHALESFQKALAIFKSVYGDNHPEVATNYNNVGGMYKMQEDFTQALEYYHKALTIYRSVYGETHPDVATSYNNIGNVCYRQEKYSQALEYFQKALTILETVYGDEHPDTQYLKKSVQIVEEKLQNQ